MPLIPIPKLIQHNVWWIKLSWRCNSKILHHNVWWTKIRWRCNAYLIQYLIPITNYTVLCDGQIWSASCIVFIIQYLIPILIPSGMVVSITAILILGVLSLCEFLSILKANFFIYLFIYLSMYLKVTLFWSLTAWEKLSPF